MKSQDCARTSGWQITMALMAGALGPLGGCGSASPPAGPTMGSSDYATSSGAGATSEDSGTASSSSSGGGTSSSSSGAGSSGASSSGASSGAVSTNDGGSESAVSPDGGPGPTPSDDGSLPTPVRPAGCVTGQVTPNQVVLIGDSYLDPAYSNAGVDLYANAQMAGSLAANTTYRHYYQGGAAMNNGALQFNIPYQYENQALTDLTVMNPTDIDTIIMDGGGNDVLIDDQSCLTSGPPGNTGCVSEINGVVTRATSLLQEMATKGVKHIVYFFYPHLDPAGGGLLPTPAPDVNVTLDYAYPLAEQICCGTTFTSSLTSYTCQGNMSGTQCTFIDMRPAFEGHVVDYIKTTDHVHPTPAGAQVIANLIWATMVKSCIAQ